MCPQILFRKLEKCAPKKCTVCPQKTRGRVKNVPQNFVQKTENVPPKKHPAGVVGEAKMSKTNVLKLGVATCKISLPTVKKFYILGKSAVTGRNFKTKLLTLETKKPLPKNRGFIYKTGMS